MTVPSGPRANSRHVARADPAEAEALVGQVYVAHSIELPQGETTVDLDLVTARIGSLTVGRLSYARKVVLHSEPTVDVHIDITLRGWAEMSSGSGPASRIDVGAGAVFPPGQPAHVTMSQDCALLAVMVPMVTVETELELLLGQSLVAPLDMAFELDLTAPLGKSWDPILKLLIEELRRPTALSQHPAAARRIERLLVDALLLGHDHNYREQLDRGAVAGALTAVGRAVQLIETSPTEDWSTASLAKEVHVSVRALQAGFHRDIGTPPMEYVRQVRLRHVRTALADADAQQTTVRAVAQQYGFTHLGRFAASYRERYGESPVEALRRPPPD